MDTVKHEATIEQCIDLAERLEYIGVGQADRLLAEVGGLRTRVAAKDEAIHVLCHDLKSGAHVIQALAEMIVRYSERGDTDRTTAKARELVRTVQARVVRINEGEAAAIKV